MLMIKYTKQFKKSLKKMTRQGKDINKLFEIVGLLQSKHTIPEKNRDHALQGRYKGTVGVRELHIEPDWLLVYQIIDNELILVLVDTGSHSDLF
ncbi:mRNA interferase YafQ [Streptococcus equinus]|nr:mRNA interferase YafQ [Streptococcus equinus]SFR66482.1 mRNA interferase YafQ [Streptococcus equinus]